MVIGASIAGLLAAAALSEACPRVTVYERDILPAAPGPRRGVSQSRQLHALQARGVRALDDLLPGLRDDLWVRRAPGGCYNRARRNTMNEVGR